MRIITADTFTQPGVVVDRRVGTGVSASRVRRKKTLLMERSFSFFARLCISSFCVPRQSLLLGKQRSVEAASPPFPPVRNRHPRRGSPDRAGGFPRRESVQPGPGGLIGA